MTIFISDNEEWNRLSAVWNRSDIKDTIAEANSVVDSVNSSVGGYVSTTVSRPPFADVESFNTKSEELHEFCLKVQSAVEEKIEEPFCYRLSWVAEAAYTLNPSEIEIKNTDGITNFYGMMAFVSSVDQGLKSAFIDSYSNIIKMEPSSDLAQIIVDAIAKHNAGKDVDSADFSEADKLTLIKYYEMLYPDEAKLLDDLFTDVERKGNVETNIINIMYIAYTSDEPYHTVFFDSLGDAKLGYTEPYIKDGEWQQEFAVYYPGENTINIDLTSADGYWACRAFFHEYGHYVDNHYGQISVPLRDAIYNDVYTHIRNEIVQFTADKEQINKILESLKYGGAELTDQYLIDIREKVIGVYNGSTNPDGTHNEGILEIDKNIVASDVYGGATDNNLHGLRYHYPPELIANDKDKKYYWYNKKGKETGAITREYFAESFSNAMTKNTDALINADVFFENANNDFKTLIESLTIKGGRK